MPDAPPPRRDPAPPPPPPPPGSTPAAPPDAPRPSPGPLSAPEPSTPSLDDRERSLDPSIVTAWRLSSAAVAAGPALVASAAAFAVLDTAAWLVLAAVIALFGAVVLWIPTLRYERWRWRLNPLAIELQHGVLVRRHDAVPYFRIQQIDVNQGPLDRLLGLATLEVTTASASGSAGLPGITAGEAPSVRTELLARAAQAVGDHPGDLQDAV